MFAALPDNHAAVAVKAKSMSHAGGMSFDCRHLFGLPVTKHQSAYHFTERTCIHSISALLHHVHDVFLQCILMTKRKLFAIAHLYKEGYRDIFFWE